MKYGVWTLLICLMIGSNLSAQSFGDATLDAPSSQPLPTTLNLSETVSDEEVEQALTEEQKQLLIEQRLKEVFIPGGGIDLLNEPTEDKSVRGGAVAVEVNEQGHSRRAEKIFLYYDNFKISSFLNNSVSCDVRFYVLSNLNRKITNLDVKLVWPGLTTAVSFPNVAPNTPTYLDYSLLGEGCYSMDKMPNIVVNRCRVKGMSSSECASKIVWLNVSSSK